MPNADSSLSGSVPAEEAVRLLRMIREGLEEEIEACEFFLSSAEKFGEPKPYGVETLRNRLAHLHAQFDGESY